MLFETYNSLQYSSFILTLKKRLKIYNKVIMQRIRKNTIKINVLSKNVKEKSIRNTN